MTSKIKILNFILSLNFNYINIFIVLLIVNEIIDRILETIKTIKI
jgi:hypothetical protein